MTIATIRARAKLSNLEWYYYRKVPPPPPLLLPPPIMFLYNLELFNTITILLILHCYRTLKSIMITGYDVVIVAEYNM